jgi:hypothetical protein
MRYFCLLVLAPVVACQVDASYPQPYAQVQVQTPPPPQVDVNVQADPNAQQAQADPNADLDATDTDPSALSDFHDALAPYGQWVDDPQYGTIWQPNPAVVGADFTPYQTAGHWTYDNDYTWVSDYDWGWAPFHYGRWTSMGPRGWGWIPGKEYAGAWVTWRNGDDGYGYVGWAPTAPSYYWRGGAAVVLTTPWFEPSYDYVETANLFVPTIGVRIIRDPVRLREFATRTRVYSPGRDYVTGGGGVRMHVRGPAPTHIGLQAERLPRPPTNNASFTHAQQFAHVQQTTPHNNLGHPTTTTTQSHPINNEVHNNNVPVSQHTTTTTHNEPISHAPPVHPQTVTPQPTATQNRRPPPPSATHVHHR